MSIIQTNVEPLPREETLVIETQTIFHTVHIQTAVRPAFKFDTKNQIFGDTDFARWL
jgi:hypothetical protein